MVTPDTERKCLECGMDTILGKPMNPSTLKQLLDENKRKSNLIRIDNMTSKNALEIDPSPDAKNRGKREAFLKK